MAHVFKEYQTVILKDLKNAQQYNGKVGTIESKLENGRYQILLHEPLKRLSIHPKNLKHHGKLHFKLVFCLMSFGNQEPFDLFPILFRNQGVGSKSGETHYARECHHA